MIGRDNKQLQFYYYTRINTFLFYIDLSTKVAYFRIVISNKRKYQIIFK